jgi:hypothetical protein
MVAGGPNDGLDIPVREIKLQTRVCRDTYGAAMKVIGNADRQEIGRWLNNRVENSHQPFLRQERAMLRFRSTKTLQKFASIHSSINNHFNLERHLTDRSTFKLNRTAALEEWRVGWNYHSKDDEFLKEIGLFAGIPSVEGWLPTDYCIPADELAALMSRFQERASPPSPQ